LIGDGVSIGVFRKNIVRRFFNNYEGQNTRGPIITLSDDRAAVLKVSMSTAQGELVLLAKYWSELCVFSGVNSGVGELIVGFATGFTQKKKGAPIEIFTMDNATNLRDMLVTRRQNPECEAVSYLVIQYVDHYTRTCVGNYSPSLRDMVQSFGAKSVAPICGVHGPYIVYALSQLAFGHAATNLVPAVLDKLMNEEQLSRVEAHKAANRTMRRWINILRHRSGL